MPTFDLVTKKNDDGIFFGAKRAAADAPNKAIDVAWLKLGHVDGCTKGLYEVYRVKTAGGVPPKTCEGLESKFEIQYAAEYWFYAQYVY